MMRKSMKTRLIKKRKNEKGPDQEAFLKEKKKKIIKMNKKIKGLIEILGNFS